MNKPKAVLFDIGDTIIQYNKFTPLVGNTELMKYSKETTDITVHDINELAEKLASDLNGHREESNIEYSCQSFQRLLFSLIGLNIELTPLEMEIIFNRESFDKELIPGVREFIEYLDEQKIRLGVLSNSSFSENALRAELEELEVPDYFEFIVSTAEYCLRKPDPRIFQVCLNKFGLNKDEVWYIGNTLKYDVQGANNIGMQAIWLNREELDIEGGCNCISIKEYSELEVILSTYLANSQCGIV